MHKSMTPIRSAYTLVELILVITLLGIAAAIVAPSMSSAGSLRVQAAVRAVVADITFAQSDALARQHRRAIVFDVPGNRYSILEVNGETLNPAFDTILVRELSNVDNRGNSRLISAVFDSGNKLIFDELGGPVQTETSTQPGAGGTIRIEGSGSIFDLGVEAYTGRVTVTRVQ
jgi:prepilin-type N-terminal cleavage/methylation domain-containing protein